MWGVEVMQISKIIFIVSLFISSGCNAETVFLNDGTALNGTISGANELSIEITTSIGKISVPREKISSISYDGKDSKKKQNNENIGNSDLIIYENQKSTALIGLTMVYSLTIVADVALGGDFLIGSAIPVVGPFINALTINDSDYFNPANATRDRLLSVLSGAVQTYFFVDYLSASNNVSKIRSNISIYPTSKPGGWNAEVAFSY